MNYEKEVEQAKAKGYNCCQTVVSVFASEMGIEEKTFIKLAAGFGGGMRKGEICGALSGAVMVLGMKYGDDTEKIADITREAIRLFEDKNDFIICKKLLGYDLSIEEENRIILEKNLKAKYCPALKGDGIRIVKELI